MSRQKTWDQRPYLHNVLYRCLWSSLPTYGQPHRAPTQTYTFGFLSLLSKDFIHHIQTEQGSPITVLYCHWKGGKIIWNIITKGMNVALEQAVSPNATVPRIFADYSTSHWALTETIQGQQGCAYPPRKKPFPIPSVRSAVGSLAWSVEIQHSWMWGA